MSIISTTIAVTRLFPLAGGGRGHFLFPYLLIDYGTVVFYPGNLVWIFAGLGFVPVSYLLMELRQGESLFSEVVVSNFLMLFDSMIFSLICNQIVLSLFFRDKRSQLKLEAANEKLLKVTGQVAHDLNSPLSSMRAVVDHCKDSSTLGADFLNLLDLSYNRLQGIVGDLLQKRGKEDSKIVFSLHKVLDELVGEIFSNTGGRVVFRKEYGEAISCLGHRDRIQRAFGNILKNAGEAIDGRGEIRIRTSIEDGRAAVSIADTGRGIAPDLLAKVLKGGYTKGKRGGHGIGMQVVREVVEEHRGELRAGSEPGKGTTFYILLPLPDSQDVRSSSVEEGAGSFDIALTPSEQVIVIDDDPSAQLQWEILLRPKGYEILAYESWEDFEKKSPHRPAKLRTAIVDYHFENSEMNGLEIVSRLKKAGYANLILCTAEYWKPLIRQQAKDLGVPICPKPMPKVVVRS